MDWNLDLYWSQHKELLVLAAELGGLPFDGARPEVHEQARQLLFKLAGKLTVHLQMEDRRLYPELFAAQDVELRRTAMRFQDEMGSIRSVADGFFRHWLASKAIDRDPERFVRELSQLLQALGERIAAEDGVLFRLAERGR